MKFIREATSSQKIAVIGAFYEITSAAVDFLGAGDELRVGSGLERRSPPA